MLRKWVVLIVSCGCVAGLVAGRVHAGDKDTPLSKIMKKIDAETKKVREGTKSRLSFKKAGKQIVTASERLKTLGDETRPFTEPAEKQKQPAAKWLDMTDKFIEATDGMAKAAAKGDFDSATKAWKRLDLSCSNCHGAFRPEVGDDF